MEGRQSVLKFLGGRGFSLLELLVVISLIFLLMAILMPVLDRARYRARLLCSQNNIRQIAIAVNVYAANNDNSYPVSIATNGSDARHLSWTMPTRLVAVDALGPRQVRSISGYLSGYVEDVETMYCPNTPRQFKYLTEAWASAEAWDNPDNGPGLDELRGSYSFFWDYNGYLPEQDRVFMGPQTAEGGKGQSKLLITGYFAYNHRRHPGLFGSCERFKDAQVTGESTFYSSYWQGPATLDQIDIKIGAGYTDGHVDTYTSSDSIVLKISKSPDGGVPFPDRMEMGDLYLPRQALW